MLEVCPDELAESLSQGPPMVCSEAERWDLASQEQQGQDVTPHVASSETEWRETKMTGDLLINKQDRDHWCKDEGQSVSTEGPTQIFDISIS